jgi:hypothetical protein
MPSMTVWQASSLLLDLDGHRVFKYRLFFYIEVTGIVTPLSKQVVSDVSDCVNVIYLFIYIYQGQPYSGR